MLRKKKNKSGGGLPAPSLLTAVATTDTSILLNWHDNSTGETGFQIEMGTDGVTFPTIVLVGSGTTSHTISGLTGNSPYYFRVKATPSSGYSNEASAVTFDSDAWAAIAAMSVPYNNADATNVNDAFLTMKVAGIFDGPNATCISFFGMSPVSEAASSVDWITLSSGTNNSLPWSASGFEVDGANYFDSDVKLDSISGFDISNFIIIIRYSTSFSGDGPIVGVSESAVGDYSILLKYVAPDFYSAGKIESTVPVTGAFSIDDTSPYFYSIGAGPWTLGPTTWGVHLDRKAGQTSNTTVPSALTSWPFYIGAENVDGTPNFGTDQGVITGFFIFCNMSSVDLYEYTELIVPTIDAYNGNYGR